MAKTHTPNYFSIIPATVRYDKNLPAMARLLFSELTALCTKEGYCWASNKYFAELYEVTPQTVSTWLALLDGKGYVNIQFEEQENGTKKRKIFIDTPLRENPTPLKENLNTPSENSDTPLRKFLIPLKNNLNHNSKTNSTSNNTSIKSRAIAPEKPFDFLSVIPKGWDPEHFERLVAGWVRARRKKPPTEYAKELAITDLIKYFPDWKDAKERMEKAIKSGWLDLVFKEDKEPKSVLPESGRYAHERGLKFDKA